MPRSRVVVGTGTAAASVSPARVDVACGPRRLAHSLVLQSLEPWLLRLSVRCSRADPATWMLVDPRDPRGHTPTAGFARDALAQRHSCPPWRGEFAAGHTRLWREAAATPQPADQVQVHVQHSADRAVTVRIDRADRAVLWQDRTSGGAYRLVQAADASAAGGSAYDGFVHYSAVTQSHAFYGTGETSGGINKRGRRIRLRGMDALGYDAERGGPLYKHFPWYIASSQQQCTGRSGMADVVIGVLYDNGSEAVFDFAAEIDAFHGQYQHVSVAAGMLDVYFVLGMSIPDVVQRLAQLTGLPALPPRWSLGYLGSTMAYTEAADAQTQLLRFLRDCRDRYSIPCDAFHLSSGYTTDEAGRRNVFTWNTSRIPDPKSLAKAFLDQGVHLIANVKPHVLHTHPAYPSLLSASALLRDPDDPDTKAASVAYWSAGVGDAAAASFLDFTSASGAAWWRSQARAALLDLGITGVWNDNNEFAVDEDVVCSNEAPESAGTPSSSKDSIGRVGRTSQVLLMAQASYQAMLDDKPEYRPMLVTRCAGPGVQRFAGSWSGDNETSWHTLRWNIPMGLSLGLSAFPNTGHDIGGFVTSSGPPDPELLLRWVQCGIVHPRFTIHSLALSPDEVNTPWMHPSVLDAVRACILFRYRLIPFLYSLLVHACRTGEPILRPLVYHFPRERDESFLFMLGPHVLVACVVDAGATSVALTTPRADQQTVMWYDWMSGRAISPGTTVTLTAPLDGLPPPMLVRAGGVVAMHEEGAAPRFVDDPDLPMARCVLRVFLHPGMQATETLLVFDDGQLRPGAVSAVSTHLIIRVAAGSVMICPASGEGGEQQLDGPWYFPFTGILLRVVGVSSVHVSCRCPVPVSVDVEYEAGNSNEAVSTTTSQ